MSHPTHRYSLGKRLFPFVEWLKTYQLSFFRDDLLSGLTVAVVLIPQAMAYAMLAGLPPVYGLYAAAITPLIAALWGSLRQLATGPIAIMSLLVLTTLSTMAEPGSTRFIELSLLLSFMVGVFYLIIGIFRLGIVMAFISHSAVKGFTSSAAIIISATQLPHLLGLTVSRHEFIFPMLVEIIREITTLKTVTTVLGLASFVFIYSLKKRRPNFPAGLAAMIITTLAVWWLGLDEKGVAVLGETPAGLPAFRMLEIDYDILGELVGPAIVIALVSFAETYSVGKAISSETGQKLNVNQEFIGQGMANLIGSFFQCYPVSGSFSRTAINYASGAKTGISSVVSSLSVVLALLFLTPLLTLIPKAVLAALVIGAVLTLFHPREVIALWKVSRHDGFVAILVFSLALITKPDYALLIGVLASLMFFLWRTMHPRIIRITKDPVHNMFVDADEFNKPSCPQILQLRSDNVIYFANAEYTVDHLLERLEEVETPLKFLLLDFESVGCIDITGIDELLVLFDDIRSRGVALVFRGVHIQVQEAMQRSGFIDKLQSECSLQSGCLIMNRNEAISYLFSHLDHEYCKKNCSYELFYECATVK
ncbi:MAG: sulfate permease [Deltaproteobacteria bacterium]|nr:sulfate permease [Deltaproteobacteria bacterium]